MSGVLHSTLPSGTLPGSLPRGPAAGAHLPQLDGLRGVAILLVLAQNLYIVTGSSGRVDRLFAAAAHAGWAGVDLFFVLSGFLITGILLDTKGRSGYLRNFFARRMLRIFPLYYGVLVLLFVVLPHLKIVEPSALQPVVSSQGWYWSYLTNVLIARHGWEAAGLNSDHFWSLAVEEQFYLVWPVVILLLRRRGLAILCITLIVAAFWIRVFGRIADWSPTALYALGPTRMDALAMGSLAALVVRDSVAGPIADRWVATLGAVSAGVLILLGIWYRGLRPYELGVQTVGYTVIAVGAASLLLLIVSSQSARRASHLFAAAPLRFFGRYSYGIYVVHPFVLLVLQTKWPFARDLSTVRGQSWPASLLVLVVAAVISSGLGVLTWHLYEKHFLALKRHFTPPADDSHRQE